MDLSKHEIKITDMKAFKVGNAQNLEAATGCTVILCPEGASAGVSVVGGSPASRETQLLNPVNTVQKIHAVSLSGGSAYGLEAGDGVMQFLEEQGIGFDTGFGLVPIVCGASLFDLELVTNKVRPDKAMGYQACVNAYSGKEPEMGNFGAGTGATVGKWLGDAAYMKSGLGIYAAQLGAVQVAAIVSVNALGDIINYDDGHIMAGLLNADKTGFADTCDAMYQTVEQTRELWGSHPDPEIASHTNTTISCILTNAKLDKCQCNKLAAIANDGYARGIRPVHTSADGDSIFVMASGEVEVGFDAVAALACECMARAINRSASEVAPAYGLLSAQSFQ